MSDLFDPHQLTSEKDEVRVPPATLRPSVNENTGSATFALSHCSRPLHRHLCADRSISTAVPNECQIISIRPLTI
jgi:hypothetical protein